VRKLFTIVLICTCFSSTAQNLVPNPSFEQYNFCPNNSSDLNSVKNWFMPVNAPFNFQYFNSCASSITSNCSVPLNSSGYELAFTGSAYISLALAGNFSSIAQDRNIRNYTSIKLNSTLIVNRYYSVSLMYSCIDSVFYATKNFSVLFTNSTPQFGSPFTPPYTILPYSPQLDNNDFLDNKVGWKKLSWIYKANGNENYMTLGNFKNNTQSDAIISNPLASLISGKAAAIYIDDVIVEPYNCATGLIKDTTVCNNETINIQLPANILASYTWQDGSIGANYIINNAGTYWVTTNALGCTATDTIKVKYKYATPFSLGGNKTLCKNETLILQVPNAYNSYLWQNGTTAPTLAVKDSGLYFVTATQGKCTYTDTAKITTINCICDPQVPTAFTPNNDNMNDQFGPKLNCAVTNYAFNIYNRYGQVVFTSTNPSAKWNGTFNNAPSPAGSYVYVLQYSIKGDAILQKQGSFLLVE
jgi:gliding motility-associated-like protein